MRKLIDGLWVGFGMCLMAMFWTWVSMSWLLGEVLTIDQFRVIIESMVHWIEWVML